jgi:CRISPR-associated endonuclease/helicase Cas3
MLGLRLIAAHHGQARPSIFAYDENRAAEDSTELAAQIAEDFVMLQRQWGVWGLAWWEALLRAADVAASREKPTHEGR